MVTKVVGSIPIIRPIKNMRYNYKQGVTKKDKQGHKARWVIFLIVFAVISYGGFLAAILSLNGWPLNTYDTTAKIVKNTKPGQKGDSLFIPSLNLALSLNLKSLQVSGKPNDNFVIRGNSFGVSLLPHAIREASPFFNLSGLRKDDEIFIDKSRVRYAYVVTEKKGDQYLTLQSGTVKKYANPIGTVAWRDGSPYIEAL